MNLQDNVNLQDNASLQNCAQLTRKGDPDRFLAAMTMPSAARTRVLPLYAFNVEISRAVWVSDEPLIGQMRLQFWRDQLTAIETGEKGDGHDVVPALATLIKTHDLPVSVLHEMVTARQSDIERAPFADDASLWTYLAGTAGNLMWLSALALGAAPDDETLLRKLGRAQGMANWLCAVPELQARGRVALPDMAAPAVADLAHAALEDINLARRTPASRAVRLAMRAGWLAAPVLKRAARTPERVVQGRLALSEFHRRARLLRLSLIGGRI